MEFYRQVPCMSQVNGCRETKNVCVFASSKKIVFAGMERIVLNSQNFSFCFSENMRTQLVTFNMHTQINVC